MSFRYTKLLLPDDFSAWTLIKIFKSLQSALWNIQSQHRVSTRRRYRDSDVVVLVLTYKRL